MLNFLLGMYLFISIVTGALIWASLIVAKKYDQKKGMTQNNFI